MDEKIIAHFRKNDQVPQPLWDHLSEAAQLAGRFAQKIRLKDAGELLGLLHDLGKASQEFQNYISSANDLIDPDSDDYINPETNKGKIDHSSAGAQWVYQYLSTLGTGGQLTGQVLALCLASHHSGLIDCLSPDGELVFQRRMGKPDESTHLSEVASVLSEEDTQALIRLCSTEAVVNGLIAYMKSLREIYDDQGTHLFKLGLFIRFLFSCLIDADRLSTANFEAPAMADLRNAGEYRAWEVLIERLEKRLVEFADKKDKNGVDHIRSQVSQNCLEFAERAKGIYQLSVPTGGGKTLASLRFGLHHAAFHKMDRVIYVIPYTSIIDQNAHEVRKILEDRDANGKFLDQVVLEHHSNLTPEEETKRRSLLAENWDAPIIFTTQVQFLEALFGSGTRGARRMHQLANAVIIFDEVQTLPVRCVHMFNVALRFLVHGCGSTAVLCTATQPLLDQVEPAQRALPLSDAQKMIPNEKELFQSLKRVEVFDRRKAGGWKNEEVAELARQELQAMGSVLIVVNTKKSASDLYQTIQAGQYGSAYHLSTNMCPAHRLDMLAEIKKKLESSEPLVCVSTQLIEAGVDIDFGAVIRYLAGLDSIAQAAGRCNRHGKRERGRVWIVNPESENLSRLPDIASGIRHAQRALSDFRDNPEIFGHDPLGPDLMARYYQYYFYDRSAEMTYPVGPTSPVGREDTLFDLLSVNQASVAVYQRIYGSAPAGTFKQSFQTAASAFHAIDSPTRGVIVPYKEEGKQIINELCSTAEIEKQFKLLKRAQRYSINLFPHEFIKMTDQFAVQEVQKGAGIFYMDNRYYDLQYGWSDEPVNDMKTLIVDLERRC